MSGIFGSSQWMYNSGDNFYNGVATQSLRFDDAGSAYLQRTPSSAGNRKTFVISCWVKRSNLGLQGIFSAKQTKDDTTALVFENSDQLLFTDRPGNSRNIDIRTNRLFRDVGAWYHIVVWVDTTEGTVEDGSDRVKIYINGVRETSFATSSYPSQNYDVAYWNNTQPHRIGVFQDNSANYYDGYISEFNFVDGTPALFTEFGETKNGVWIAKKYTGSYGTNGFRLQFNQTGTGTASSSTIGADTSGNANHFSSSGIVSSDCDMPDSPESNLATWNFLVFRRNGNKPIFSEGNTKVSGTSNQVAHTSSTIASSGKHYAEFYINDASKVITSCGVVRTMWDGGMANSYASNYGGSYYATDGTRAYNATSDSQTAPGSDRVGIEVDFANNEVEYFTVASDGTRTSRGGKLTSSDGIDFQGEGVFTASTHDVSTSYIEAYFSKYDWNGTPNTDYLEMSAESLPEPTISPNADTQADDYFNTVTWIGNEADARGISGVGFQPDWVWVKERNGTEFHNLVDSSRGSSKLLFSNDSRDEVTDANRIESFDSDGFTIGTDSAVNANNDTYVAWNWKANGGTTSSNTDGSITSTVQANTDAGFSIVTYTGTQAAATVGHGLSQAPTFIITKCRSSSNGWPCYHKFINVDNLSDAREYIIRLNNDLNYTAAGGSSIWWNNTDPTSTVFSLGANDESNKSGDTHIAYCFHDVEGFSKFGSYTGNGSTDGTFIYTGFRPAFMMYKRTDSRGHWLIDDNKTSTYNYDSNYLLANTPDAEGDTTTNSAGHMFDHLSNGFKMRNTNVDRNANGGKYIYMAFAENPFKYTNAR